MATLAVTKPAVKGGFVLDPTTNKPSPAPLLGGTGTSANTDDFPNPAGRTYLILYNEDSDEQKVTVSPLGRPSGLSVSTYEITIPTKCMAMVGPFDPNLFNNAGGSIQVKPTNANKIRASVLQLA